MPINSCDDAAGSLNNPNGSPEQLGTNNPDLKPYTLPDYERGIYEISGLSLDSCAANSQKLQDSYVAESLRISGAPINVFKLLGVHEQGNGSVLNKGNLISSSPYPGYPVSQILSGGVWKTFQAGNDVVVNSCFIGIDFGNILQESGTSAYAPIKPNMMKVGCIMLRQANNSQRFSRQVRVEISDGACEVINSNFSGSGEGNLTVQSINQNAIPGIVIIEKVSQGFRVVFNGVVQGFCSIDTVFNCPYISFTISEIAQFLLGDTFTIQIGYSWKRLGIFNLSQSSEYQTINFNYSIKAKAIRILPTLFSGNENWEILGIDFLDSPATAIDNIQDIFFNENRDRDYSKIPVMIKAQYSPTDSSSDLSRFGLNILDQYSFNVSFSSMVRDLGRPIVTGDIIEVVPEMQYDHNLKPVRKFLEVTDTGWASEGFSPYWKPTVFRFSAQQALPSQETRDIFGTIDTQKYMLPDEILANDRVSKQIDITPLSALEEAVKDAKMAVPEIGSAFETEVISGIVKNASPAKNEKGQPQAAPSVKSSQKSYIEDGLPPDGLPYSEGFKLPESTDASDGDYFRLNYPPETKIPTRLYRFSALKNRWIYQETDRRGEYSSHKPSVRAILESETKQGLGKKTT